MLLWSDAGSEYQCESGAGDCKENGLPIAEAGHLGDNEGMVI